MKHTFAELSCIALLWTGAAGVVASMFIPNTHLGQVQSLCEFSAVIALGCIAKMLLPNNHNSEEAAVTA